MAISTFLHYNTIQSLRFYSNESRWVKRKLNTFYVEVDVINVRVNIQLKVLEKNNTYYVAMANVQMQRL